MEFNPTGAIVATERGGSLADSGGFVVFVGMGTEGGKAGRGTDSVTGGGQDKLRRGAAQSQSSEDLLGSDMRR